MGKAQQGEDLRKCFASWVWVVWVWVWGSSSVGGMEVLNSDQLDSLTLRDAPEIFSKITASLLQRRLKQTLRQRAPRVFRL
mmetsp:Transcript_13316/g.29783  ORF Transcript_13316/g.29783 Transcript_13316/m.29783 type:complete len:81 (+) Transcript_13316:835-1077(+)